MLTLPDSIIAIHANVDGLSKARGSNANIAEVWSLSAASKAIDTV
jgi:hypothetical protein